MHGAISWIIVTIFAEAFEGGRTLEIREYFRILRRWWPIVLISTIVGLALGYATMLPLVNQYLPDMFATDYQSKATLFVATQNGTTASEAYQNNQFSMDRVNSYAGLVTSEQVATRAADELKGGISAGDLRGKISAVPLPKTVLLTIGVRDPDPGLAQTYANAVSDQVVALVSELETSRRGGTPSAGAVVVDEADYPTEIMGWSWWKRLLLGLALGAVLGVVLAIIVGVVDKRLRGRDSVEDAVGSPLLGGLPEDGARATSDIADFDGESAYTERVRALRTSLRFTVPAGHDRPARAIAITSPTPQEGRTTVAIDLAAAFAEAGHSVVLVNGDLRGAAIAGQLPLNDAMSKGAAARGVSTLLAGEHELAESLIANVPVGEGTLTLLPAGPKAVRTGELWATDRAAALFEQLGRTFDYVIVDTPPLDEYSDGAIVSALSDGAVLLARIGHTTESALRRALQTLRASNAALIGVAATFEGAGVVGGRSRPKKRAQGSRGPGGPRVDGGKAAATDDTEVVATSGDVVRGKHGSD